MKLQIMTMINCFSLLGLAIGWLVAKPHPEHARLYVDKMVIPVSKEKLDSFDFYHRNSEISFGKDRFAKKLKVVPKCVFIRIDSVHLGIISMSESPEKLTDVVDENKNRVNELIEGL